MKRLSLSVLAFAAFTAASARAELSLVNVSWQRAQVAGARVVSWEDAEKLTDGPPKINTRLRARLTLKNRGPVAAEGILLRYSLTGRVSPVAEDKAEEIGRAHV